MRYFIELAYNGGKFHGWQRQPNAGSVQQTLEEALTICLRKETPVTGAGRTDTGVNARKMYAHFDVFDDCRSNLSDPEQRAILIRSLNRLCGTDIAIRDIFAVKDDAHARFDATQRTYKYFVTTAKDPFVGKLAWRAPANLDYELMNEAAKVLLTTSDFTSFAKLHADAATNICDVRRADWQPAGCDADAIMAHDAMVFTISANRFLRNMVRAVVGTLVDVGRRKISIDQFKEIIEQKDRCAAGTSMPAEALFLWDVEYNFAEIKTSNY